MCVTLSSIGDCMKYDTRGCANRCQLQLSRSLVWLLFVLTCCDGPDTRGCTSTVLQSQTIVLQTLSNLRPSREIVCLKETCLKKHAL